MARANGPWLLKTTTTTSKHQSRASSLGREFPVAPPHSTSWRSALLHALLPRVTSAHLLLCSTVSDRLTLLSLHHHPHRAWGCLVAGR
ncbi:hypothetical protein CLOP_g17715 [Closterium sp. NIES-67]|nr:hypothetical protein CLOP_g17715 [Closterium sp. NIES-67]